MMVVAVRWMDVTEVLRFPVGDDIEPVEFVSVGLLDDSPSGFVKLYSRYPLNILSGESSFLLIPSGLILGIEEVGEVEI